MPGAPPVRAAAVNVAQLRAYRELRGTLFAPQAGNSNRLTHLRMLHGETRRLRLALEAERVEGSGQPEVGEGSPSR